MRLATQTTSVVFAVRRDVISAKLRYSKTTKGDVFGAILGLVVGLVAGYLGLASCGSGSIDLGDLTAALVWLTALSAATCL
jgi:hypothetical protein